VNNEKNSRKKIIMVDDDLTNLSVAKNSLTDKYDVFTVPSGKKLFQLLEKIIPDLILLDIEMPEMNGYDVIKILKSNSASSEIPIVFLTSNIDPESEVKGLSLGAVDYITKPFTQELLLKRIEVHLLVEAQKKELMNYSNDLEKLVSKKTQTLFQMQNSILKTVAELVESRDHITGGHIERTQNYLHLFVNLLLDNGIYSEELSTWDINQFIMSSQLHDVGKISIRDNILMKPGKLTDKEFEEIKKHTVYGMKIMEKIESSMPEYAVLKHAKILAASHHEKWDGTGYPNHLKGEEIPLQGRLMAIIDVYDALTNNRPYKSALTHEESLGIIKLNRGTHFDPVLCDVFIQHEKEFKSLTSSGAAGFQQVQSEVDWESVSQAVAVIMDARSGIDTMQTEKIKLYLTILMNALTKDKRYKDEVSSWDMDVFLLSAQLHDVGKIAIDDNILHKTENLTDAEFNNIKTHTDMGVKVIRQIGENVEETEMVQFAEALPGSHHEKWDGSGYPQGLKGMDIPIQGRLMAIVDVYAALTNDRPDRKRISHHDAVELIKSYSGSYFDPDLVGIFLDHEKEIGEAETCK
jgi:putative two-component system response regulator